MEITAGYSSEGPKEPKESGKKNYTLTVREISNGWIKSESWESGGKYHSQETYCEENPIKK